MSLWKSKEDLQAFSRSGAHLESIKQSGKMAREIQVITVDSMNLMPWKEAKSLVHKAKAITY